MTEKHTDPSQLAGTESAVSRLRREQTQAWEAGRRVLAEEILCGADLGDDDALVLILGEVELRFARGETPALAEYQQRFPRLAEDLAIQFALRRELSGELESLEEPLPEVPGFEVLGLLGQGAMGIVYKARQTNLERIVALKVIQGELASGEVLERFRNEGRLMARLRHPNIVAVFEVAQHQGRVFLVLELVEGQSLAQHLGGRAEPARQAAERLEVLARAVHHAHSQGVIHRDLKPANVLLSDTLIPKIADFGLAKQTDPGWLHTRSGIIVGTPAYMSPEQARGASRDVGPAADIWALGAILYECLVGRPPFTGDSALDVLQRVLDTDPLSPRSIRREVSRDLETICLKCLHKDPGKRYASASDLADDLARYLAGEPVLARRASRLERVGKWSQRNPGIAGLLGTVFLLLLLLTSGAIVAALWLGKETERARKSEHLAKVRLFDAALAQARASRTSGRPGQRLESLLALERATEVARELKLGDDQLQRLRNEVIACLPLPDVRTNLEWEGNPPGTMGLGFDATFRRYAINRGDAGIRVCSLPEHRELFRCLVPAADRPGHWAHLQFSPKGRYLVVWHSQGVQRRPMQVWDLMAGTDRPVLQVPDVSGIPGFSADERTLGIGLRGGGLELYDLPTAVRSGHFATGAQAERVVFRPDGRALAVACVQDRVVEIRDRTTGMVVRRLKHNAGVQALAWRPDGELLATGCDDHRIYLWDEVQATPTGTLEGHGWEVHDLAFDPSGDRLVSFGWDMTMRLWDVPARRLSLTLTDVRILGFSRDGLQTASLQGTRVRTWDLLLSQEHRILYGHRQQIFQLQFHPKREVLASAGYETDVRFWDAQHAQQLPRLRQRITPALLWESKGTGLLIGRKDTLWRWPVRLSEEGRRLSIGPPALLLGLEHEGGKNGWFGRMDWCGQDDRALVSCHWPANIIHFVQFAPERKVHTWSSDRAHTSSGSPDGRWIVTGSFNGGPGCTVWEPRTGRPVKSWEIGDAGAIFTQDGRWLIVSTGRHSRWGSQCRSFHTGSWEEAARIPVPRPSSSPPHLTASPDARMVAMTYTMTDIRLVWPGTLQEIATLTAPDTQLVTQLAFNGDGSLLASAAGNTIHVWDLRRIRERLAQLGLDWEGPEYPPARTPGPIQLEVLGNGGEG